MQGSCFHKLIADVSSGYFSLERFCKGKEDPDDRADTVYKVNGLYEHNDFHAH